MNEKKLTPVENSDCFSCVYYRKEDNACLAYDSIPSKYLLGKAKHRNPKDNDTGIEISYEFNLDLIEY